MMTRGLLCAAVAIAAVAGLSLFWDGGVVETEATAFIPQYLADRAPLAKIFDPHLNDFDAYQARELSYVVDYADAMFHVLVLRAFGVPWFISLSSMLATMLIAIVITLGVRRTMPGLDAATAALVFAVLVSSFQFVSTAGIYYRSSKMMLAAAVLAVLFRLRRAAIERRRGDGVAIALLCVIAGLLDRQGFFFAVVVAVLLGWHFFRTRALGDIGGAVLFAVLFLMAYNLLIAPNLVQALNGYWPNFEYQARSLRSVALLWQPWYFVRAFGLLSENAIVSIGGPVIAAFALAMLLWASRPMLPAAMRSRAVHYVLAALLAQVLMFGAIIHQHPPIDEYVDHRLWYYTLPFVATLMFAMLLWLNALAPSLTAAQRRSTQLVLAAIVLANLAGLDRHRDVMAHGPYFERVFAQSTLIRSSLAAGAPDPSLDEGNREFVEAEEKLTAAGR